MRMRVGGCWWFSKSDSGTAEVKTPDTQKRQEERNGVNDEVNEKKRG
jgi:hypothetical protein